MVNNKKKNPQFPKNVRANGYLEDTDYCILLTQVEVTTSPPEGTIMLVCRKLLRSS